ncbi:hypothetical protein N431DRAFT_515018 [Stipitochalara longipes BDJ]|nr:hypothetical protein N431DRAFT_515018 [Stipitochalara longipes BDJ]
MAPTSKLFLALIVSSSMVLGAATNFTTNWNPNGDGCGGTKGFLSCYGTQASKGVTYLDNCANNNKEGTTAYQSCTNEYTGLWLASNVGCWLESCWNQVYSCEYQLTAMSYFDGAISGGLTQSAVVPFYPAPDEASAGACCSSLFSSQSSKASLTTSIACNLGYVYGNLTAEFSRLSSDKCSILNNGTFTCIKDYDFPFAGTTAYNPLSLPAGEPGTEALSNTAGNAFTAFPSPTMTLTLYPAYTSTITAAPFEKSAGADGNEVQGPSIVGGGAGTTAMDVGATGTGTGTGSAAATATKANSGTRMSGNLVLLSIPVALVVVKSTRA